MKPFASLDEVAAAYDAALAAGATPEEAVGWMVPHSQLANFLALLRVEGLGDGARLLDVGCGLGALKDVLDRLGLRVDYTGIDISANMIAAARARHPGVRFERRDILSAPPDERFDFVLCSGALNLLMTEHARFVARMIRAMFGLCTRALSFNLLSAHALAANPVLQREPGRYFYAWPADVFRFCATLSPLVALDHASRATTFAVHVYRRNPAAAERYLAQARPGPRWDASARAALGYLTELGLGDEAEALLAGLEPIAVVASQLGALCAERGDVEAARAHFERAAGLDPASVWPVLGLAQLAARAGRLDEAAALVRRARALEPDHAGAIEVEVHVALARGRAAEGAAAAAALPDGVDRDYLLGTTATDPADAERHLRRALERAPRLLDAIVRLAVLAERRGDGAEAAALWGRALALAPDDARIAQRAARAGARPTL